MRRQIHRPLRTLLTGLLATAAASTGLVAIGAGTAQAATPLPAHVFAPYFEAYSGDSPSTLSTQSGANYETMAFIQTASTGSCTAYWNGDSSQPLTSATFGSDISAIQAKGGDVIPSFGGYTADDTATDIADSCTSVASIAAVYESVITTYNVTRIDLDTEDNSLTNTAGITRRNQAIAQVEAWAASSGRTVQFQYTLPTTTSGLASSGLAVLKNAVANNAVVSVVNIMTFDYYDGATHEMGTDAENAATGLYSQLASLYPTKTAAQLWGMIGITLMPGIDDYGAAETTTVADATNVTAWATSKGLAELSFWALERDNGGCVGTAGSDTCSGIAQGTWDFSHAMEPFTSGSSTPPAGNDFSLADSPGSASVAAGASTTSTISTAVTSGSAESVSLAASGLPTGVTAAFSPTSVTSGGSSTLTLTASSTAAAGSYPITITGTAASGSHTATYTLTVTSSTPTGNNFSLSDSPSSASVAAGASTTSTISTAVTSGSAESVSLAASGLPSGVTAAFSPTSVTSGGSSTLTLTASSTAAAGSYPITITGTAASGSHTATYTLTVTSSTPPTSGSLVNGGFETGSLSPWTCQTGGAVVSTPVHTGSHALQVTPTSSQTGQCSQTVTLSPNTSYTLSGWVQGSYAYLGVSGGATASSWTSSTGWTKLSVPFTTGSSGTVTVYVHGWYAQGNVYADDLALS